MDHWKPPQSLFPPHFPHPSSSSSQRVETEIKNTQVARKVQKADREKLRRDRLNEQFIELGNALGSVCLSLDPDRPKNDKATVLTDAVVMLKDLTKQVSNLKAEYASLSDESRELTQEKNELREDKMKLKTDIDGLQTQYQQRLRAMFPWTAVDPTLMMGPPPPYPCPMPLPVSTTQIPVHPPLHPYAFFPNQNAVAPSAQFLSYPSPCNPNPISEQHPGISAASHPQPSNSRSQTTCLRDSASKACDQDRTFGKLDDSSNVATELELKTPGSSVAESSTLNKEPDASVDTKEQVWAQTVRKELTDERSMGGGSSTTSSLHESSDSVGDGSLAES